MMDGTFSFQSLASFERCPYAYRLDLTEANKGLYAQEFLDKVVRNAIAALNRRRICGHVIDKESALSAFWNSWDLQTELNPLCHETDKAELLKIGEKCMTNFVRFVSGFDSDEIIACDLRGELPVPGGYVEIWVDEVSMKGNTMVLTRYVTEPGVRTRKDFENDYETFLTLQWVRGNVPASEKCIVQWRLLHPYIELGSEVPDIKITEALKEVGRNVSTLRACQDFRQRESDHCAQCQYHTDCPRFTHGLSQDMAGRELVSRYAEYQEKIDALKQRIEMLETQRDEVGRKLIDYADGHGYTALTDGNYKASVSHLKKAELPKEKGEVIRRLQETGKLEEMSTVNYSRLRADIVKGIADRKISEMAVIVDVDRVNLKKLR